MENRKEISKASKTGSLKDWKRGPETVYQREHPTGISKASKASKTGSKRGPETVYQKEISNDSKMGRPTPSQRPQTPPRNGR